MRRRTGRLRPSPRLSPALSRVLIVLPASLGFELKSPPPSYTRSQIIAKTPRAPAEFCVLLRILGLGPLAEAARSFERGHSPQSERQHEAVVAIVVDIEKELSYKN